MDFDQVLEEIGEFGRYQITNYLLICLPVMFAAANSLSYVFTAGTPAYRCLIPECDNSDPIQRQLYPSWLVNATPGTFDKKGHFTPASCYRYQLNDTEFPTIRNRVASWSDTQLLLISSSQCPKELFLTETRERCYEWVYDTEERTILQEWQLTCAENAWRLAFVGTMHFAGLVVGTACSGYMADRFGRKIIFVLCIIFMAVTGIGQGLAWDYNSFLVFAFLNAVGTSGVYPLAFIIGVEMVGPRMREMSSIVLNYFYAVGEALVGLTAWLLPKWQLLQYALSVPPLCFIIYYWLVPESVRWLIARNEREKATMIIKRAAEINKKELSIALLTKFQSETVTASSNQDANCQATNNCTEDQESNENLKRKQSDIWLAVKQVFSSKTLMFRYSIMLYIWAINSIVYYGLSLNSTNLSGNKYLNFSLVCLIEIPGYSLAWFSLKKYGRRLSLTGSMLLCGVTCATGGYITKGSTWAIVTLFLIGKLGITSSFAVIYAYTAEMMPTVIRSGGVGVMSTFARFGAMLAPFVPLLGAYYEALPLLLFGGASASAGLMALLLPETFHEKLPDTVEDAKQLGRSKKQNKRKITSKVEENNQSFDNVISNSSENSDNV